MTNRASTNLLNVEPASVDVVKTYQGLNDPDTVHIAVVNVDERAVSFILSGKWNSHDIMSCLYRSGLIKSFGGCTELQPFEIINQMRKQFFSMGKPEIAYNAYDLKENDITKIRLFNTPDAIGDSVIYIVDMPQLDVVICHPDNRRIIMKSATWYNLFETGGA